MTNNQSIDTVCKLVAGSININVTNCTLCEWMHALKFSQLHGFLLFSTLRPPARCCIVEQRLDLCHPVPYAGWGCWTVAIHRRCQLPRLMSVGADHLLTTTFPQISYLLSDWNKLLIGSSDPSLSLLVLGRADHSTFLVLTTSLVVSYRNY